MIALPSLPSPAPSLRLPAREWILAGVFFLAALLLFTRHNDFPSFYHPDEPSKARQLIDGEFNFNHPLLLLQATRIITLTGGDPSSGQAVTEAGRNASAFFAAGAIAALMLIAAHLRGTGASIAVGLLLLGNHQLYELAHYMKEDPALAFGMAVFFLGLVRAWVSPTPTNLVLLGLGAGLAISGKYIGALVLPLMLGPILGSPHRLRAIATAGGALLLTFVVVNFPMFQSLPAFSGNLSREMDYAVHGHKGLSRAVPHGVYGAVFREATNPLIWVLLGVYYLGLILRWRSSHQVEKALAIFPLVYVLILSFSPKTHHRYFLPDTLLFCLLAGMGFPYLLKDSRQKIIHALQILLLVGAIIWTFILGYQKDQSFQNDARQALVAFVRAQVPADAVIVQDKRVNLPSRTNPRHSDSPYFLEQPLEGKLFAADVGTIEELRARNVRYVAVAEGDYGRFFLKTHKPREDEQELYEKRKAFYTQLFAEGELLWECEAGPHQYLQPALKFYRLPPK